MGDDKASVIVQSGDSSSTEASDVGSISVEDQDVGTLHIRSELKDAKRLLAEEKQRGDRLAATVTNLQTELAKLFQLQMTMEERVVQRKTTDTDQVLSAFELLTTHVQKLEHESRASRAVAAAAATSTSLVAARNQWPYMCANINEEEEDDEHDDADDDDHDDASVPLSVAPTSLNFLPRKVKAPMASSSSKLMNSAAARNHHKVPPGFFFKPPPGLCEEYAGAGLGAKPKGPTWADVVTGGPARVPLPKTHKMPAVQGFTPWGM